MTTDLNENIYFKCASLFPFLVRLIFALSEFFFLISLSPHHDFFFYFNCNVSFCVCCLII